MKDAEYRDEERERGRGRARSYRSSSLPVRIAASIGFASSSVRIRRARKA